MAIIPSSPLLSRSSLSKRDGEKGCRDVQTVEGVRHFCVHTYIYIFYRAHIATRSSSRTTHTYLRPPFYTNRGTERRGDTWDRSYTRMRRGGGRRRRGGGEERVWAGNRNESSNTKGGGTKHVCAWRGRRGGTERLDFSDSEFCSSFFLPLLSLSLSHAHPLITDSPYLPSATRTTFSPAYHSFLRPRTLSTTSFPLPFFPPPPRNNVLSRSPSARLRLLRAV